jgi:K+-sensing histidine kinase KdpD
MSERSRLRGRIRTFIDDSHLGRSMLTSLELRLASFSRPFVVLVGLLLLALIGLVDAVTGAFAVSVFYLVPIGLVTYARGRWVGTAMAATAACAWMAVELGARVTSWDQAVTYWNWLSRFYVYVAIVVLVAPMRDVVRWEREVAEREAEAAEKLRALNELRAALEQDAYGELERLEAMVEFRNALTLAERGATIGR